MQAAIATEPARGPSGLPLVGVLWQIRGDPLGFFTRVARDYGRVARFRVGTTDIWLLSHPSDIEELLVGHRDQTIKDRSTRALSPVLGQGLLTSEGATWKRHRKLAAPSFQPRHLAVYADTMVDAALRHLPPPGAGDVHDVTTRLTLDIVVRTLFGGDPGSAADRVGPVLGGLMDAFEREQRTLWRLVPPWVPGPHRRRVREGTVELDALILALVRARRSLPAGDDLLSRLLEARDEDGRGMDDQQVRDEALTLFLAGHETTSIALTHALWLLARHPVVQERVRAEVLALDGEPSFATLPRLIETRAVVQEVLRLYPPAWAFGREPVVPISIGGHRIPAGVQVVVSPWVVHHDRQWWTAPEQFRPERWATDAVREMPRFAYFPFGGGPRVCVGNHFATMETTLVLATWLRHRTFEPVSGFVPELIPAVTLRPRNGMQLRVATYPRL